MSNQNIVLICGVPSSGKTTGLMHMTNQEKGVYFNTDLKTLPFKSKFTEVSITEAIQINDYVAQVEAEPNMEFAVLDTVSFLMSQFEQQNVVGSANGQQAWGNYANFYKQLIHQIKSGTKDYAIMTHTEDKLNEKDMVLETKAAIKGSVGRIGIEADFSVILTAKRMSIKALKGYENDLLHITEEEEEDEYKYVLMTKVDKNTLGEKTRAPIGLWDRKEKYIDNNLQIVFDKLHEYYNN
jgi:hypothetical protein